MIYGVTVFLIWGLFPFFFPLLEPAGPLEILAHRMVWTLVVMLGVLAATRSLGRLRGIDRRTWLQVAAAAVLISVNWGTYILAVNTGHVAEAALGYFINPLVSVVLGVVVLGESMHRGQLVAVGIAVVAVGVLTVGAGEPPWLALTLALTFGLYGLAKKTVRLSAAVSLTAEAAIVLPAALALLVWIGVQGESHFLGHGAGHTLLLMSAGLVTAVPLLLFGMAAKRIPLTTLGMLQYLTPGLQMLWAITVFRESMDATRWAGFGLIWLALMVFTLDATRTGGWGGRPPART